MKTALRILVLLGVLGSSPASDPNVDGKVRTLARLLHEITPAVVNIAVSSGSPEEDNPLLKDPFFRRFFGLQDKSAPSPA